MSSILVAEFTTAWNTNLEQLVLGCIEHDYDFLDHSTLDSEDPYDQKLRIKIETLQGEDLIAIWNIILAYDYKLGVDNYLYQIASLSVQRSSNREWLYIIFSFLVQNKRDCLIFKYRQLLLDANTDTRIIIEELFPCTINNHTSLVVCNEMYRILYKHAVYWDVLV